MVLKRSNDYFRLFVKREGKVVLGRRCSNLWIMTTVLFVAFLALAFSNASTRYLAYKMDDPFIKWQNIENDNSGQAFNDLVAELSMESVQSRYHFSGVKEDYKLDVNMCGKYTWGGYFSYCRLYTEMDTELMRTILDSTNVVNRPAFDVSGLRDAVLGVVITEQMLQMLGYEDDVPPYLYMAYGTDGPDGEWRSLQYNDSDEFLYIKLPIPVLGVVKRLPGNLPYNASAVLNGNYQDALNICSYKNTRISNSLLYFVDERVDEGELRAMLSRLCEEAGYPNAEIFSPRIPWLMPFAKGKLLEVENAWMMGWEAVKAVNDAVSASFPEDQVVRVFDYQIDRERLCLPQYADYLTVEFKDLEKLSQFVHFVSETTGGEIELDITQTNVKENLNTVQLLAGILSLSLILFAITCIVLFIVNLLQSYFQRVKRNLGTFKAFGISNRELMNVYLVIIVAAVSAALVMALVAVLLLQWVLPLREPGFRYLSLWSPLTGLSIAIVFVASVLTVFFVMGRLLKATPGDLIYDRQ